MASAAAAPSASSPAGASGAAQSNAGPPGTLAQNIAAAEQKVQPAPPGGLDPAKLPDVVGIHIGLPTDQAIAQIKSLYPDVGHGSFLYSHIKYAPTNDPPYISSITTGRGHDTLFAIFSGPPDARLVMMRRSLGFETPPTTETLKNAAIQKYGPNFIQPSQIDYFWAFDEEGKSLVLTKAQAQCVQGVGVTSTQGQTGNLQMMTSYLGIYTPVPQQQQQMLNNMLRSKCFQGVVVKVELGGLPGGTATQMMVEVTEVGADLRAAFAAEHYLMQAGEAQTNQQLKNANQQAAPKF